MSLDKLAGQAVAAALSAGAGEAEVWAEETRSREAWRARELVTQLFPHRDNRERKGES